MTRIDKTPVTLTGVYQYSAPSYSGYGYETRYIYTMTADDGTVYVWKTTAFMSVQVPYTGKEGMHNFEDRKGNPIDYAPVNKGDRIVISASIKGDGEYNGQPQTELTRVSVKEILSKGKTKEEIEAEREAERKAKRQEQLDTLGDGDFIWRMPYKQYKERYADCETVIGSYEKTNYYPATIQVIIRRGRLVPSGVRGQHYSGYEFFVYLEDGSKIRTCYRAVSEDNAQKRCEKDYPEAKEIVGGKIFHYGCLTIAQ